MKKLNLRTLLIAIVITYTNIAVSVNQAQVGDDNMNALMSVVNEQKLIPIQILGSQDNAKFGTSIDIDGDLAVVGAPYLNGGAAYILKFDSGNSVWKVMHFLQSYDIGASDLFGTSVSISGNRVVIGAPEAEGGGGVYVFEKGVTNWPQTAKLTGSDTVNGDQLGQSVSIVNDRILVGASNHDAHGSAYIFEFNNGTWGQNIKIDANDGASGDDFGHSVSLFGNRVLIGAPSDDDNGDESGSAYIFQVNENAVSQISKLTAIDGANQDQLGFSVSLSSDTALVGAIGSGSGMGAAYVFKSDVGWAQTQKLLASDGSINEQFGFSVNITDDWILIGARNSLNGGANAQGAAYVFRKNIIMAWVEEEKMIADDINTDDGFGSAVAIYGDMFFVASPAYDNQINVNSGSVYYFHYVDIGVDELWVQLNKSSADDHVNLSLKKQYGYSVSLDGKRALIGAPEQSSGYGAAYLYEFVSGAWVFVDTLAPSDGSQSDRFGISVSLHGNHAVIGAKDAGSGQVYIFEMINGIWSETDILVAPSGYDYGKAVSINSNRIVVGANTNGNAFGAVYVYEKENGTWSQTAVLEADDGIVFSNFGQSVSLLGDRVLIGAPSQNQGGPEVAYIFDYFDSQWTQSSILNERSLGGRTRFGSSVSLTENRAIVGSLYFGRAYIFDLIEGNWAESALLSHPLITLHDGFGTSVSIMGDRAVVGSIYETDDVNGISSGAFFLYELQSNQWSLLDTIYPSDGESQTQFGFSANLSKDAILIGNITHGSSGAAYSYNQTFTVSGQVTGLASGNLVGLTESTSSESLIENNGMFEFQFDYLSGENYAIIVDTQPTTPSQTCTVSGGELLDGAGMIDGASVVDILVECETNSYEIGGTLTGLLDGNSITLQNNSTDDIVLNTNGGFVFSSEILDLQAYNVTIMNQPSNPIQNCTVESGSSSVAGADVQSIIVSCEIGDDLVFSSGFE